MTDQKYLTVESWIQRASRVSDVILNFVFPPVCASCGKVGKLLCDECYLDVVWLAEPICLSCGRVTAVTTSTCSVCQQRPLPLTTIRAATIFDGPIPDMIHQLKYNGMFGLAGILAQLMVDAWPKWQHPVDLVIPIPLHPSRYKARGYNQSEKLAAAFCQQTNLQIGTSALKRIRHTRPQVGLDAAERLENMQNAFQADSSLVAGKRVLLVDDVCTTGATLAAAAEALLAAGATAVSAYCLARAM